ncbi:hypothetical protein GCM10027091_53560 [Streptomyces daliensis]
METQPSDGMAAAPGQARMAALRVPFPRVSPVSAPVRAQPGRWARSSCGGCGDGNIATEHGRYVQEAADARSLSYSDWSPITFGQTGKIDKGPRSAVGSSWRRDPK